MTRLLYTDIADATTRIPVDLFDIDSAEDGDPGTGVL